MVINRKIIISLCLSLCVGITSYMSNFFLSTYPDSQAQIKVLDSKYNNLGEDIKEIKDTQKEFSKDQKYLIKVLLENRNAKRKNREND